MDRPTNSKKNIYRDSDRYLIGEQPGLAVLFSGLIVAFFIGYTAKSFLSPQRITDRIAKAASHIHKDVQVRFDSASLILSDGVLPRFSVLISNVRLESEQACWMSPQMKIDQLRLPLSLWAALTGRSPVQSLIAGNVDLILRSDSKACVDTPVETKTKPEDFRAKAPTPIVTLSPLAQSEKYANAVRNLSVKKFSVAHTLYPQYSTEFLDFRVNVKSFEPKVIEVRAKTQLLKDEQVGDYLSHANLYVEYKDSPEAIVQTHFFGNWREGHYSIIANYTINERLLTMEGDLRHIPLSQVLSILKKYKLVSPELVSKQAWISSKARLVGDIDHLKEAPFEVTAFQVEGDLGDLTIDRIAFSSIDPLKYAPIQMDIKKLNLEKMLEFLNRPGKSKMLGQLGTFSGRAEIISDKNIRLRGEHSGLEFIFSNRGQQELQVLSSIQGEASLQDNDWNFKISRLQPQNGSAIGSVKLKADRDFKKVSFDAQIDELIFAPAVQKLMTNGGQVGAMSLNADLNMAEGEVVDVKGRFALEELSTEGMVFDKIKTQISGAKKDFSFQVQGNFLDFTPTSAAGTLLAPLGVSEGDNLRISKVTGVMKTKDFKNLEWKNVQGQIVNEGKMSTDGSWSPQGELQGKVQVREGKSTRHFGISGTRDNPLIEPAQESSPRR